MNSPSHDTIANRAQQIWHEIGQPEGRDDETWLIAERQLTTEGEDPEPELSGAAYAAHAKAEEESGDDDEENLPPTVEGKKSRLASRQKESARAPQSAHHTEPKPTPAPSGKPLWPKPKSG